MFPVGRDRIENRGEESEVFQQGGSVVMKIVFDIYMPGDFSAGIAGFSDMVSIEVDSGDPGGDAGEFKEHMKQALVEWYDGAKVTEI